MVGEEVPRRDSLKRLMVDMLVHQEIITHQLLPGLWLERQHGQALPLFG